MLLVSCFLSLSIGFFVGFLFKSAAVDSQDWMVMKWNKDVLGYRPVMIGSRLFRNDKVAMSLEIDTSDFPDDGHVVE